MPLFVWAFCCNHSCRRLDSWKTLSEHCLVNPGAHELSPGGLHLSFCSIKHLMYFESGINVVALPYSFPLLLPQLFSVYVPSGEIQIEKVFSFFKLRNSSSLRNQFISRETNEPGASSHSTHMRASALEGTAEGCHSSSTARCGDHDPLSYRHPYFLWVGLLISPSSFSYPYTFFMKSI